MKIKENSRDLSVDVIAIYWVNGIRHVLVIPYDGYEGLIVVTEEKCEVVDYNIDGFILRMGTLGDILVHALASKDDLLDDMINHKPGANEEFLRRLRNSASEAVSSDDR